MAVLKRLHCRRYGHEDVGQEHDICGRRTANYETQYEVNIPIKHLNDRVNM